MGKKEEDALCRFEFLRRRKEQSVGNPLQLNQVIESTRYEKETSDHIFDNPSYWKREKVLERNYNLKTITKYYHIFILMSDIQVNKYFTKLLILTTDIKNINNSVT